MDDDSCMEMRSPERMVMGIVLPELFLFLIAAPYTSSLVSKTMATSLNAMSEEVQTEFDLVLYTKDLALNKVVFLKKLF